MVLGRPVLRVPRNPLLCILPNLPFGLPGQRLATAVGSLLPPLQQLLLQLPRDHQLPAAAAVARQQLLQALVVLKLAVFFFPAAWTSHCCPLGAALAVVLLVPAGGSVLHGTNRRQRGSQQQCSLCRLHCVCCSTLHKHGSNTAGDFDCPRMTRFCCCVRQPIRT